MLLNVFESNCERTYLQAGITQCSPMQSTLSALATVVEHEKDCADVTELKMIGTD